MAQVDTSMYNALGVRPKSIGEYSAELDAADLRKQGMQQNALSLQMGQQKLDEYGRSIQDANALRGVVSGFGADPTQNVMKLFGAGRLAEAQAYQKSIDESRKAGAGVAKDTVETELKTLEGALKKQSYIAQLAGSAVDQASWERNLDMAAQVGADVSKIPRQFDPNIARQLAQAALTSQQQLEARYKELDFKRNQANDMMIPDPNNPGQFIPNRPLIGAKAEVSRAGAASVNNYGSPVAGVDAEGKPVFFQPTKTGGAPSIVPGVRPPKDPNAEKPLTEGQGIATTFAARMADAARVIEALEASGTSGSDIGTMAAGNRVTNVGAPAEGQQYRQAQENWVTANLRKESGAAIPVAEMDKDIAKWFPKIGDKKEVRDQKARARKVAEQGMLVQAGPGAKQVQGILDRSAPQGATQPAPVQVTSDADYNALKPGTRFVTPDGKTGTKR